MASKSLGTLTLDLVARTGGFVQGMDQAERSSQKWRKQVEKDLATVAKVSGAAIGTAAAATAALVVQQVRAATEISNMAQMAGSGTTEFQRYAAAADVVGISQEKLSDQLKDFNEKVGEFQQSGGGGMKDFFEQIAPKIDITADAFRNLSGPQALQLYYDSLEKAGLSQQQMSFYLESMASDTTALIPLLRDGGAGFKLLGDEAERAGAIMSEETITAADRLSAATLVANNAMAGFRNTIGEQLLPVLGDLAVEFSTVAEEGAVAEDVATVLTGTIKGLTAAAVGAFATFQILGKGMGGLAASTREAMEDMSWWEKLNPMKIMTKTIGSAVREENDAAKAAIDDLDQTLLRYGELINGIFDAGSGDAGGDSTIDRIAKLREEMRKLSSEVAGGSAGSISDEAKKAQEAITKEITALERAAETWGMTADEVKLYGLEVQGATEAQLGRARAALEDVAAMEKAKEQQEAYLRLVQDLRTDEEKLTDQLRERLAVLDAIAAAGGVGSDEYQETARRIVDGGFTDAPEFGGLAPEVAGPFGELSKIDEAQEKLQEWYDTQLEMLEEFRAERADLAAQWDAQELALKQEHEDELARIEQARQMAQLAAAESIFGDLAGLAKTFAGEQSGIYKAMFAVQKAASIAQSAVAIQTGIAMAAANPWPANLAAMASVAAATASIVGNIAAVGMAHDGIDSVPQTGTWLLQKGERVITAETSAKLDRTLERVASNQGGGAKPPNLINNGPPMTMRQELQGDQINYILELAEDRMSSSVMKDGKLGKATRQAFGLRRYAK